MEQPLGSVAQGGENEGLSSSEIFVWFETKSTCEIHHSRGIES